MGPNTCKLTIWNNAKILLYHLHQVSLLHTYIALQYIPSFIIAHWHCTQSYHILTLHTAIALNHTMFQHCTLALHSIIPCLTLHTYIALNHTKFQYCTLTLYPIITWSYSHAVCFCFSFQYFVAKLALNGKINFLPIEKVDRLLCKY